MADTSLRIVLNTNVIIRAISGRSLSSLLFDALLNQQFTLCVSTEILPEYEEKITQIFDAEVAELVVITLVVLPNVQRTEVYFNLRLIAQDADDDKFVNCAFAANTHYIVPEDRHFRILTHINFPKSMC